MKAVVRYPYRDRDTGDVRYLGDEVELCADRLAELSAKGFVEPVPEFGPTAQAAEAEGASPEQAPDGEDDEPAQAPGAEGPARAPQSEDMTGAELRAAIEAKGGFAPKRANKGQLASILESL